MKINKKLLIVLIVASIIPVVLLRIEDWVSGTITTYYELFESLLINGLISLVVTLSISWVILSILAWLNRKLPWNENVLKRLLAEVCLTFPTALLLGLLMGSIAYPINAQPNQPYSSFIFNFLAISGVMNFVLVAISDWFYFFGRWKNSLIENQKAIADNEILNREKIAAQYEALKNQINPHFLFNSLNVLSSLIHSDPEKAEEFIDEFAGLYRYILEHNEHAVVPLADEISIAKSYAYLQEIRFGAAIQFLFQVSEKDIHAYHIFPLALQTSLENAVKHNQASLKRSLTIEIVVENGHLVVKNNLHLREHKSDSTGIGTQNLTKRYRSYNLTPQFVKTANHYLVYLPLLTPAQLATS